MLKRLLILTFFLSFSVKAQVLSGHQEFVHYSHAQKEEFIVKVMELMVELENKYEKAPFEDKPHYSHLLQQLKEIIISSAYAAEIDPTVFAHDLTSLLDPNSTADDRCIYAGWVSRTRPDMSVTGTRQVCQHPRSLNRNTPEAKAYTKSSSCGKQSNNKIACNPAIFGFKNQAQGSQFCVPAGLHNSENSSYACMEHALGIKKEAGADPAEKRMEYLKKQFEGKPELVNNLFGFIYKTCLCDNQEKEIINQSYLNNVRPHRTCLGLVNSIAETNHCVTFDALKSTEMDIFKDIRGFTNNIAGKKKGREVDSDYRALLGTLKTRFGSDYARICGGEAPVPDTGTAPKEMKPCQARCDFVDGKYQDCVFTSGDEVLNIKPELPAMEVGSFPATSGDKVYNCIPSKRSLDEEGISCSIVVDGDNAALTINHPEDMKVETKKTTWTPQQQGDGVITTITLGEESEVSVEVLVEYKEQSKTLRCKGSREDQEPSVKIKTDSADETTKVFGTVVTPEEHPGWSFKWTRTNSSSSSTSSAAPEAVIQGESSVQESKDKAETQSNSSNETTLSSRGHTHSAPREAEAYTVCVQLEKGDKSTAPSCETVEPKAKEDEEVTPATPKPRVGGPQLPSFQPPMRKGGNFSRGGLL